MKVNYEVENKMVWCQVGKIDVDENYDELIQSGNYNNEWLDDCHTIYVSANDNIPYIAYHLYSGTIRVVGPQFDICTDYLDIVCHILTHGNLDGMFSFNN